MFFNPGSNFGWDQEICLSGKGNEMALIYAHSDSHQSVSLHLLVKLYREK
jgi:hypothetical protein